MVGIVFLFFYIVIKNSYPSIRDCKGRTIHFINQGVNIKLIGPKRFIFKYLKINLFGPITRDE